MTARAAFCPDVTPRHQKTSAAGHRGDRVIRGCAHLRRWRYHAAISVLSALEGLNIATPAVGPYVLPAALVILVALFAIQPQGTARIGKAFGPIMCVWFLAIAAMGVAGITRHPGVLAALNPLYGLQYLLSNGFASFLILGGVFLCVTGAEALYADMGHFGSRRSDSPGRSSFCPVYC